jgi:hypothetical protein
MLSAGSEAVSAHVHLLTYACACTHALFGSNKKRILSPWAQEACQLCDLGPKQSGSVSRPNSRGRGYSSSFGADVAVFSLHHQTLKVRGVDRTPYLGDVAVVVHPGKKEMGTPLADTPTRPVTRHGGMRDLHESSFSLSGKSKGMANWIKALACISSDHPAPSPPMWGDNCGVYY